MREATMPQAVMLKIHAETQKQEQDRGGQVADDQLTR